MDVGVNKDYSKYGPCSILSNHKLIAILWWNGTHGNYGLSICCDYFENAVRIQRDTLLCSLSHVLSFLLSIQYNMALQNHND